MRPPSGGASWPPGGLGSLEMKKPLDHHLAHQQHLREFSQRLSRSRTREQELDYGVDL